MHSSIDANFHSFSHSFTGNRKVSVILFLPSGSPFLLPHSVKWGKQTSKQTLSAMCLRLCEKYMESSDLAYLFKLARRSSHFKIKWRILILKGALTPCISQGSVRFLKILYQRHRKPHSFDNICVTPTIWQSLLQALWVLPALQCLDIGAGIRWQTIILHIAISEYICDSS